MDWGRMPFGSTGRMHARKSEHGIGGLFYLYAEGTQVPQGVSLMNMTIKMEIWELNTLHKSQAEGIFYWSS